MIHDPDTTKTVVSGFSWSKRKNIVLYREILYDIVTSNQRKEKNMSDINVTSEEFLLQVANYCEQDYLSFLDDFLSVNEIKKDDRQFVSSRVPYLSTRLNLTTDDTFKLICALELHDVRSSEWGSYAIHPFNLGALVQEVPKMTLYDIQMGNLDEQIREIVNPQFDDGHEDNTLISRFGNGHTEFRCRDSNEDWYTVNFYSRCCVMHDILLYYHRYTAQEVFCWSERVFECYDNDIWNHISVKRGDEHVTIPYMSMVDCQSPVIHGILNPRLLELVHKEWCSIAID